MQDFTKNANVKTADAKLAAQAKQTRWLTRNRFWNLAFLFLVPLQIFIAAAFWSGWMLLFPIATTIAIFGFVPVDTSAADNKEPNAVKAIKYAGYIWFWSIVAFILAGSKILSIFGLEIGQFGFGETVFFIFLVPVSILCYYNIPLASCVEKADPSEFNHGGINSSLKSSPLNYGIEHSRRITSDPGYSYLPGNINHR